MTMGTATLLAVMLGVVYTEALAISVEKPGKP
jgi:hypothetical protein